jgi:mitochondrial import receptor subunit TOM70
MEQSDPEKAFECFEKAIEHNPNDPDIYYHRGQGKSNEAEGTMT